MSKSEYIVNKNGFNFSSSNKPAKVCVKTAKKESLKVVSVLKAVALIAVCLVAYGLIK